MATYSSPRNTTLQNGAGTVITSWWWHMRELRDALVAAGMVQTADTNQIDFTLAEGNTTTPAAMTSGSINTGFIVRLDDALANDAVSPKPFYMRIRSAPGSGTTALAQFWIQLGTGSDGAGNLTGVTGSITSGAWMPWTASTGGSNQVNQRATRSSGNGSEIAVLLHESPNAINEVTFFLQIERTRNETGAYDGEGVLVNLTYGGISRGTFGPYAYHAVFPTNGNTRPLSYGFSRDVHVPKTIMDRSTMVDGNLVGPMHPYGGGFFPKFRQSHTAFLLPHADMQNYGNIFTMPLYGVNRSFRQVGWNIPYYVIHNHHGGTNTGGDVELQRFALCMMWE